MSSNYDGATGERLGRGVDLPDGFSEEFMSRSLRIPADRAGTGVHDGGALWTPVTGYIPGDSTWRTDWLLTDNDSGAIDSDLVLGTNASRDMWSVSGNSVSQPPLPWLPTAWRYAARWGCSIRRPPRCTPWSSLRMGCHLYGKRLN